MEGARGSGDATLQVNPALFGIVQAGMFSYPATERAQQIRLKDTIHSDVSGFASAIATSSFLSSSRERNSARSWMRTRPSSNLATPCRKGMSGRMEAAD